MQLTSTLPHFSSSPLICEHLRLVVRIFLHLANELAAHSQHTQAYICLEEIS